MKIYIEWILDERECEACGWSIAQGARVHIDDNLAIELIPAASCTDEIHYSDSDVFSEILKHLGHEFSESE